MRNTPGSPFYREPITIDLYNYKEEDLKSAFGNYGDSPKLHYYINTITKHSSIKNKKDWFNKHYNADILVSSNDGTPLYALYNSPFSESEKTAQVFFSTLRSQYESKQYFDETEGQL